MKKLTALTLAAGLSAAAPAFAAKVSFSLDIEALVQGDGTTAISDTGLLVLVVDTAGDGFDLPGDGSFVSDDDREVAKWDLGDPKYSFDSPDITLLTEGGVTYGNDWSEGDRLALFWFPTLSGDETPGADTAYGVFADALGSASGDAWEMPASGTLLHSLKLFTEAATKLVMFGDYPNAAGATSFAVNNPPSTGTPDSPSVGVTVAGTKNDLSWTSATNPSLGYIVQRRTSGGDDWETIGFATGSDTSFADTSVRPGREYDYRLQSIDTFATAASNIPSVTAERSVFGNVSTRSRIVAGDARTQMFGGVVATGNAPTKNVILQAIGRSFFAGQNNFVADPALTVFRGTDQIASNDDWMGSENALAMDGAMSIGNAVELGAEGSKDASELIQATMNVGHTFAVSSVGGDSGDVLLGIFNADSAELGLNDNRIVNLSARGYLDGEDASSVFAGGTIIRGNVPKEVLVMAWGPYLAGISPDLDGQVIENPSLKLRQLSDSETVIASNDDWEVQSPSTSAVATVETDVDRIRNVMSTLGYQLYADGGTDALLLVTLEPGAYTFEIEGAGGSGIGLFAINEVEID